MYGMDSGHGLWVLLGLLIVIVPFWRICTRTGYPGWLSLLVPFANIALLYFIAFADRSVDKKQINDAEHSE